MKQTLLEMIQVIIWLHRLHTDEFIFVWYSKNGNRRLNRSSGAKTELLDGRRHNLVPGLHSYRRGPAWYVVTIQDCRYNKQLSNF